MPISLRRYIFLFAMLTAVSPFVASALVQAFPQYAKTIADLFGVPVAFAIAQSTAYHFLFRNKRIPTTNEYWRLVGSCTAVGTGLAIVSIMLTDAFSGMSTGFIVFMLAMIISVQFALLAMSFSRFTGGRILKHIEKAASKPANTSGS